MFPSIIRTALTMTFHFEGGKQAAEPGPLILGHLKESPRKILTKSKPPKARSLGSSGLKVMEA